MRLNCAARLKSNWSFSFLAARRRFSRSMRTAKCCSQTQRRIGYFMSRKASCKGSRSASSFLRLQVFRLPRTNRRGFTRKWSAGAGGKMVRCSSLTCGFRRTTRNPAPG